MRVLHIVDSMDCGGAQTALKAMMECREAEGFHLAVLRSVPCALGIDSAFVDVCPSRSRLSPAPLFSLRDIIRTRRIDILHCHLQRSCLFGLLVRRIWFPELRLVFQEHGQILGSDANLGIENVLYRAFVCRSQPWVDRFLANSRHTLDALAHCSPEIAEKGSVVFVPVRPDPPLPRETLEARRRRHRDHGLPPDSFVVGFAGRLIRRKGWRDLVEAARLLLPGRDIAIVIAGDGPERQELRRALEEAPLAGRARWLGFVEDMAEFYRTIDCLAVPSHWEPQGLVQIEAQSHGIPVVAAAVPGMRETLAHERNALLFPPGDSAALAQCIERVIADEVLRDRLVRLGRENAQSFSVSVFVHRLREIYGELLRPGLANPSAHSQEGSIGR